MDGKHKLLGYYNYTVILTYVGMVFGFIGIVNAFDWRPMNAVICLMVSGFCDMFDGAIASTMKRTPQEKCFGIQIDSLSDLICFGVLPASIVYNLSGRGTAILVLSALYVLCALIRLAYFNVDEQERQRTSSQSREIYYGLPVTMSAMFIPLAYGIGNILSLNGGNLLPITLLLIAAFFLIPIRLRKPNYIGKMCVAICGVMEVLFISFTCIAL